MAVAVLASVLRVSHVRIITLLLRGSCGFCIIRLVTVDMKLALSLRLVPGHLPILLSSRCSDDYACREREALAGKDFIAKRVQVVQRLAVNPHFLQLQAHIKLNPVVPACIGLGVFVLRFCRR